MDQRTAALARAHQIALDWLTSLEDRPVKQFLAGRPGPLPVLLFISVAGATRQVRLPDHVAWDERLGEGLRRAAGVPVAVELRSGADERLA